MPRLKTTEISSQSPSRGQDRRGHSVPTIHQAYRGVIAAVLVGVVYPRLALLGNYPGMDEGSYAFISALFEYGFHQKTVYGLSLYPLLFSWVYNLPGMPMIWFRLGDLIFATIAGILFCRIIMREIGGTWPAVFLAIVFLTPLNCEPVIDSGYKNSIAAALAFFFGAVNLSQHIVNRKSNLWYLVGALTAMAILLRESFILFAPLGFFAILMGWGLGEAWRYCIGGIVAATLTLLLVNIVMGDSGWVEECINGYLGRGKIYANESGRILANLFAKGRNSLLLFSGQLLFTALTFTLFLTIKKARRLSVKKLTFWISTILIALVEPFTKIGFVYHFAICLPGMGVCCALAWRGIFASRPNFLNKKISMVAVGVLALLCLGETCRLLPLPSQMMMTVKVLREYPSWKWPAEYVSRSNPLLVAEEVGMDKGASLAASGFSMYLYYLTGHMPPAKGYFDSDDQYRLADLSRTFALLNGDKARMKLALEKNSPDILAIGGSNEPHESDYHRELTDIVESTGLYELVKYVPHDAKRNYGWMDYRIYKLKKPDSGRE